MDDNNWSSVDSYPVAGQEILFDETLVNVQTNQNLNQNYSIAAGDLQKKYATK
jgi:hypothetical protein